MATGIPEMKPVAQAKINRKCVERKLLSEKAAVYKGDTGKFPFC
jgi:hypothetical protein